MEREWQPGEQREERDRTSGKILLPIWETKAQGREKDAGS
jgi:hypothetical protein